MSTHALFHYEFVEDEQHGKTRAEYGKAVLSELSEKLTAEFGKGFTLTNLKNMRQFYLTFPKSHTLRGELTWSHYRLLIKVKDDNVRLWYMNEAADQAWSSRQLDRQISVLYYERLLCSQDKTAIQAEAQHFQSKMCVSSKKLDKTYFLTQL